MKQAAALSLALAGAVGCADPIAPARDSYVAEREAEGARYEALYQREREALEKARAAAYRLAADERRRGSFLVDARHRQRVEADTQARLHAARRLSLAPAQGSAVILEQPGAWLFRLAPGSLFLPGTSLLRAGGDERLAALAAALRRGPACDVRLAVLDDVDGVRAAAWQLAERRTRRIHDALCAHGVPVTAFLPPPRRVPAGTQIDVLIRERPAPAP